MTYACSLMLTLLSNLCVAANLCMSTFVHNILTCDNRTRLSQGCRTVPVNWAIIVRQSHGDCAMTMQPPRDVSMFELAGFSVSCFFLFYTFEVNQKLDVAHVWYMNAQKYAMIA